MNFQTAVLYSSVLIVFYFVFMCFLKNKVPSYKQKKEAAIHEVGHLFAAHLGGRDVFYREAHEIHLSNNLWDSSYYKPGAYLPDEVDPGKEFAFFRFSRLAIVGGYCAQKMYVPDSSPVISSIVDILKYRIFYFVESFFYGGESEGFKSDCNEVDKFLMANQDLFWLMVDLVVEKGELKINSLSEYGDIVY